MFFRGKEVEFEKKLSDIFCRQDFLQFKTVIRFQKHWKMAVLQLFLLVTLIRSVRKTTKKALSPPFFNFLEFWWLFLIAKNLADKKYPIIFFRIQPPSLRKTCLVDLSGEGGLIRKKIIRCFLSARHFYIQNSHQNLGKMKNGDVREFFLVSLILSQKYSFKNQRPYLHIMDTKNNSSVAIFHYFEVLTSVSYVKKSCGQKRCDNFFSNSTSFPC